MQNGSHMKKYQQATRSGISLLNTEHSVCCRRLISKETSRWCYFATAASARYYDDTTLVASAAESGQTAVLTGDVTDWTLNTTVRVRIKWKDNIKKNLVVTDSRLVKMNVNLF